MGSYLKNVIEQTEDYRRKNNIDRNDFLQYVINLRGKKRNQENNSGIILPFRKLKSINCLIL